MTHNTREVEEIIEEKIKGYYEDIEQHERTKQAIKNKEIVYIGEFGNVLCEEDYFAWEEWVNSVAIGGSSREKFIKVNLNLHHQLQKAREEEKIRAIEIIKDELRTAPLEVQMTKGIIFASIVGRIQAELDPLPTRVTE